MANSSTTFDEPAWRAACEKAAAYAVQGCGQSHGYYVDRVSAAIDGLADQLPEAHRAHALAIAREWDYATDEERVEAQDWNAEHGFCSHGIELGFCPAGCGSG